MEGNFFSFGWSMENYCKHSIPFIRCLLCTFSTFDDACVMVSMPIYCCHKTLLVKREHKTVGLNKMFDLCRSHDLENFPLHSIVKKKYFHFSRQRC